MRDFLTDAEGGSIEDAFRKIGVLQQQQGFQAGRSDTGFNQGLAMSGQGYQDNPANILAILAQMYGGQAGDAAQGVGNLATASTANRKGEIPQWLLDLMPKEAS